MNHDDFNRAALVFFDTLSSQLKTHGIKFQDHWHVDHVCYRVETENEYLSKKELFKEFGYLLCESEVNGRLISTYKLFKPLHWNGFQIDLIELPAPKSGKKTRQGFEHVEVVVDLTFDEIKKLYSHCSFKEKGLEKLFNQELEVELENCSVKFHQLSLESVINFEQSHKVFEVIKKHKIFETLKSFSPVVAGTYPLAITTVESDVDILLSGENLGEIGKCIKQHFGSRSDFFLTMKVVEDEPTVLARFQIDEIKFELFGQKVPSVKQTAYSHFLIEERLLKYGRDSFRKKITTLREHGLKTEPAFGQALGLRTNPYYELLQLQKLSESELKAKFSLGAQ